MAKGSLSRALHSQSRSPPPFPSPPRAFSLCKLLAVTCARQIPQTGNIPPQLCPAAFLPPPPRPIRCVIPCLVQPFRSWPYYSTLVNQDQRVSTRVPSLSRLLLFLLDLIYWLVFQSQLFSVCVPLLSGYRLRSTGTRCYCFLSVFPVSRHVPPDLARHRAVVFPSAAEIWITWMVNGIGESGRDKVWLDESYRWSAKPKRGTLVSAIW